MTEELTLLEKAALLSGDNIWQSRAVPHAGIRPMFFSDGPHGIRRQVGSGDHLGINGSQPATCFPTAATVANSWDLSLAEQVGEALGAEASAQGVDVVLGPGLNTKRSPLCGRDFEYFSEDPYLSGTLAAGYVRGIQSRGVAASPKHFAANSQELRRMASDSVVDERTLRELYLTAFEIVVREAGPRVIMSSYNRINGTYAHENAHLLQEILRDEWGFNGAVVTDWGGGNDPVAGVKAGGTLEMPSPGFDSVRQLLEAVESGALGMDDLDARVAEVTELAAWLDSSEPVAADGAAHHDLARRVAEDSIVLLKNDDGLLPLAPGTRIAVVGDFAKTPRYQGAGSSLVNPTQLTTALGSIPGADLDMVSYAQGFERGAARDDALEAEAVNAARRADVVVLYLGLDEVSESEGMDRTHLRLPDSQVAMLKLMRGVTDRIVVVLSAGSVIEMPWIDSCSALIHGYLGGQAGAEAMLNVITGKVNPSGRLAETYPLTVEDVPSSSYFPGRGREAQYREGLYVGYRYYVSAGVPVRFPFGFGLSYTTFEYTDLKVSSTGASFVIENTGSSKGADVAQLYVARTSDGVFRPARELKGFTKVKLNPGERARVTIDFDRYTFRHFDTATDGWVVEAGDYEVIVGQHVDDVRLSAAHRVDGVDPRGSDVELPSYQSASVTNVSDREFEALLGRPLTIPAHGRIELGRNDPLLAMHEARSPLARLTASVLKRLIARSESKGKPDLNLYFLYNMPFRAISKMSGTSASLPMVDAILRIVNGHLFRGAGALLREYFANRRVTRRLRREFTATAHGEPGTAPAAQS